MYMDVRACAVALVLPQLRVAFLCCPYDHGLLHHELGHRLPRLYLMAYLQSGGLQHHEHVPKLMGA